ncbi:MAG: hypothetical protein IJ709_09490, partial [Selenomonas sp.]|nr:hypothetical protein [Selenomonas sp.]
SPYLMGKAGVANPSGDDGAIEVLRAQKFNYRSQIAELNRMGGEINAEKISNLSDQLRSVEDRIKDVAADHSFGEAFSVSISPEASAMYGASVAKAQAAAEDKML